MKIQDQKVVSVSYTLSVNDSIGQPEEMVEQTSPGKPFVFLFGSGGLIEAFEANLNGLQAGDSFDFLIQAHEGYGLKMDDHVVKIPREAFLDEQGNFDDEMIAEGNILPMTDQEGNQLQGQVIEITEAFVMMDFNHPLAGKNLHFVGQVQAVRDATAEELDHGHVHGEGGHHH
jgi:FKBP-type peptidyl-prolyl cis-trans isomerase SlyD